MSKEKQVIVPLEEYEQLVRDQKALQSKLLYVKERLGNYYDYNYQYVLVNPDDAIKKMKQSVDEAHKAAIEAKFEHKEFTAKISKLEYELSIANQKKKRFFGLF